MGRGPGPSWRALLAILACSLVLASCGARWSDEERATVHGRGRSATPAAASTGTGAETGGASAGDAPSGSGTGEVAGTTGGSPTAATTPTGSATGATGGPTAGGSLPCAAPSSAPGVASDALTVGNLATISGPVPGLGATAQAGARSYVAYLNSTGGACGRQIRLLTGDDGNEGSRSRSIMTDFAPKVLGMIGWFAPSSGAAADLIKAQHIPILGTAGDQAIRALPTMFNLNPPPPARPAKKFEYLKAQGVKTAAVVTLSAAAAVDELNQHQAQMEAAGIKVVSRQILPLTTLSFDSTARAVANSGADYLFFLSSEGMDASMARSMKGTGYHLKFEEYLTAYGSNYSTLAGSAADGTSSWIRSLPIEEAASNPELATFLQWMRRTVPNAAPDVFAVDAWASAKAFFDALQQLEGPISRDALVAQLKTFTSYDAAGLIGRIDLAHDLSNGCLIGVRFDDGRWHRMAPQTGFLC